MTSAFICYSHIDRHAADNIADELRNRRVDVFIDYQGLSAGEIEEQLGRQIMVKDYFIPILSPRSVESKWVRSEIGLARDEKDRGKIIPVLLEKIEWYKVFTLITLNRIDLTQWKPGRQMNDEIAELARLMKLPPKTIEPEPGTPLELAESGKRAHMTLYKTGENAPRPGRYLWVMHTDGTRSPIPAPVEQVIRLQRGDVFPPVRSVNKGSYWRSADQRPQT